MIVAHAAADRTAQTGGDTGTGNAGYSCSETVKTAAAELKSSVSRLTFLYGPRLIGI